MFSALAEGQTDKENVKIEDRLNTFIALAPIVNLENNPSEALQEVSYHWKPVVDLVEGVGVYELRDPKTEKRLTKICQMQLLDDVCSLIDTWFSKMPPYEDQTSWDLVSTLPQSSASIKQLIHYGQIIKTGVFKQYDYGSDEDNIAHYGNSTVPELNLDNISHEVPIAIFVGVQDNMADPLDVAWLRNKLGDKVVKYVELDQFDHQSFSIGKNMTWTADVLEFLDKKSK